jgi:hypothetical protein
MNKVEFQAARGVLRWAGIGVMPHADLSQRALNGIKDFAGEGQAIKVREVLEGIHRGVLPQQGVCHDAAQALELMYDRVNDADAAVEAPHG